jgi:uncharacterized membrane protein
MKRSLQEIVELVVFGLIALLLATGLLWVVGWVFGVIGTVFVWLAGLIWALLRFIVPVAIVAAIVYFVVRLVQQGPSERARGEAAGTATAPPPPPPTAPGDTAAGTSAAASPPGDTPPAPASDPAAPAAPAAPHAPPPPEPGAPGAAPASADDTRSGAPEGGTLPPTSGEHGEEGRRDA